MFKFIGENCNIRNVTLIGHNASGYDSYLVMKEFALTKPPLIAGKKVLSVTISNPYTSKSNMIKWRKEKKIKGTKDILQQITLRCSMKHMNFSLDKCGKCYEIPINLRKTKLGAELSHDDITKDNFLNLKDQWEPYLIKDVLSLGCCVLKYNKQMVERVGENMQSNVSAPSLCFKGWYKDLEKQGISLYSHVDKFTREFIRRSVKGGRVSANIRKFESDKYNNIIKI